FLAGLEAGRVILVRTKADLAAADAAGEANRPASTAVVVSAVEGRGISALRDALLGLAFGGILGEPGEEPLVTRARHARAIRAAREEVAAFLAAMDAAVPMELAATHLGAATGALEELIGPVGVDDVLERVFGDFCVGK
ncbi:MAG TPA: hypothetical protein VEW03_03585, partial [Longimicrobiaceae bacterium]|nr:hypothetical protein [Longimicrobiaceae bacterium]